MTPDPPASQQYTLRAMPSLATMEGTISSEMERSVRRVSFAVSAPSGKTRLSPDEMTLRRFPSSQTHDPPDGKPLRLAHQNHFGSECATGSVYWHLPAKVELKKSHLGKPPLTECVLRHPPCQSELAEAPTTFCEAPRINKYTQSNRAMERVP